MDVYQIKILGQKGFRVVGQLCLESWLYWHSKTVVKVYKAELLQMLELRAEVWGRPEV